MPCGSYYQLTWPSLHVHCPSAESLLLFVPLRAMSCLLPRQPKPSDMLFLFNQVLWLLCLNLKTLRVLMLLYLKVQMIPLSKEGRCSLGPQISGQTTFWETQICNTQVQVKHI